MGRFDKMPIAKQATKGTEGGGRDELAPDLFQTCFILRREDLAFA
jgi:hypothetical protein